MVDLAGSERAKRTGNTGIELKEAGDINNSLMELQKTMKKLRENQQRCHGDKQYIGYRDSDLTWLFKTNFEDGSSVRMVVCVQQLPEEYDETLVAMRLSVAVD